jgi:hypothetical protein
MQIEKARVVAALRSRGLHERAEWFDREMPMLIDAYKNSGLLQTLGLDPVALSAVDVALPIP